MAIYLGSSKKKLCIGSKKLNTPYSAPVVNGILLKSSDGYILKDKNNLYLIPKESE